MKVFVVLASLLLAASAAPQVTVQKVGLGAPTLQRAPAFDSASIQSHRLGGNFAYATAEAHAYASVTPEISRATFPISETTHTQEAPVIATVKKAPVVKTHHAASPVIAHQPVLAKQHVVGPVAAHTTVEQPLQKVRTVQHHVAQAAPALHYAAHPAVGYPAHPAVGYAAHPGYAYAPAPHHAYAHPIAAAPAIAAVEA